MEGHGLGGTMNRGTLLALMLLGISGGGSELEEFRPRDPRPEPPTPTPDSGWQRAATEALARHQDHEKMKRRKATRRRRIKRRGW